MRPFTDLAMNPFQSIIHLLSDPNIAFILLTLGFYGLLFELQSPNFVTGILGAIALILAFIGFGSLPLNVGGADPDRARVLLFVLEFDGDEPRPADRRRAGLLRAGRVHAVHGAGQPGRSRCLRRGPAVVVMAAVTAAFVGLVPVHHRSRPPSLVRLRR